MPEEISLSGAKTKEEKYQSLLPQIEALIFDEDDLTANLANVSAALKEAFGYFWVGFYLVRDNQLVLGPFQGPVACTRINFGKGVCGAAWEKSGVILVDNVDEFPGHIACNSASKSEIVVPIVLKGKVLGVLDVDSDVLAAFDETDKKYLSDLCAKLARLFQ